MAYERPLGVTTRKLGVPAVAVPVPDPLVISLLPLVSVPLPDSVDVLSDSAPGLALSVAAQPVASPMPKPATAIPACHALKRPETHASGLGDLLAIGTDSSFQIEP